MKTIQIFSLLVATVTAAGCATNSSQEVLNAYSNMIFYSKTCADAGMLTKDLAAKGISIGQSNLYKSDTPRLQARLEQMLESGERATKSRCDNVELQIMAGESTRNAKSTIAVPTYTAPRQTTCNTYFGQTYCTTY